MCRKTWMMVHSCYPKIECILICFCGTWSAYCSMASSRCMGRTFTFKALSGYVFDFKMFHPLSLMPSSPWKWVRGQNDAVYSTCRVYWMWSLAFGAWAQQLNSDSKIMFICQMPTNFVCVTLWYHYLKLSLAVLKHSRTGKIFSSSICEVKRGGGAYTFMLSLWKIR